MFFWFFDLSSRRDLFLHFEQFLLYGFELISLVVIALIAQFFVRSAILVSKLVV